MLTHLKSNFNINMENKKILHCRNINKIHRTILERGKILPHKYIRDRPFNLQGGGGGYGFLFRSVIFFRTTRELEYLFFLVAKREFFFQNSTLGYMTNTLNQIFFFLHQNQNIFFSNIGNQNIFFRKKS